MISYARLTPGPGWQPMRALLYYSQRLIVWRALRTRIALSAAAIIRIVHRARREPADAMVDQIARDGYGMLPPLISNDSIDEMLAYLEGRQVFLRDGRLVLAAAVPADQPLATFPLATTINCPHVLELANHPRLLRFAAAYLHCSPTISSIKLRWSYPCRGMDVVQSFHRDTDDWSFIKLFLYLTDVDETSGPHVFVRGSHLDRRRDLFCRPHSDDEVRLRYGPAALASVIGPRGTMFLADTSGMHKGAIPLRRPRLVFEVCYSVLPVFALRYEPAQVTRDRPELDRYINRLIIAA
jgi:hypothetical protein